MFTWVRTAWWSGISAALSGGSAPAPPRTLPALPLLCSTAQGPFGLDLLCCAVCPLDTLCCRNAHTPPRSPQYVQEGSDTAGQSASPRGADAASTPCSGCWNNAIQFYSFFWICFLKKMTVNIWAEEPTCSHTPTGFLPVLVETGSTGLQEPRTGQNAGCCWTGPTHGGAGAPTGKLGERTKRCMLV